MRHMAFSGAPWYAGSSRERRNRVPPCAAAPQAQAAVPASALSSRSASISRAAGRRGRANRWAEGPEGRADGPSGEARLWQWAPGRRLDDRCALHSLRGSALKSMHSPAAAGLTRVGCAVCQPEGLYNALVLGQRIDAACTGRSVIGLRHWQEGGCTYPEARNIPAQTAHTAGRAPAHRPPPQPSTPTGMRCEAQQHCQRQLGSLQVGSACSWQCRGSSGARHPRRRRRHQRRCRLAAAAGGQRHPGAFRGLHCQRGCAGGAEALEERIHSWLG